MRIALFTPFSPELGGGSAQLRSHLRYLPELDIVWYYLANRPTANSRNKWLGVRLSTSEFLSDLAGRSWFLPGSKSRIKSLVQQIDADLYWVVGHYEGISVAAELIAQKKKVHLTIHDDPFGTWARSQRYSAFRPLLRGIFPRILRSAQSVDVTSWGMRNLYRQNYGVKSFSLYLHVPALPQLRVVPDPTCLTVGHIGTLYHPQPFLAFLSACKQIAQEQKRALRVIRIGASPEMEKIAARDGQTFVSHGDLAEPEAITVLAACDFLYAMYPPGAKYELFRRTSLPVKVSTYVQTQRPIFAHTPCDSSLACVVAKYKIGTVCDATTDRLIAKDISMLLQDPVPLENFVRAANDLMGPTQLQQLKAALSGQDWQHFPESDCLDS